jgi:hypothetical protein
MTKRRTIIKNTRARNVYIVRSLSREDWVKAGGMKQRRRELAKA